MFSNEASKFTVTEKEFAQQVGVSVSMIRELRRLGRLRPIRLGRRVLYLRSDIPLVLEQHRAALAEEGA